jgi:hypothetical protein
MANDTTYPPPDQYSPVEILDTGLVHRGLDSGMALCLAGGAYRVRARVAINSHFGRRDARPARQEERE